MKLVLVKPKEEAKIVELPKKHTYKDLKKFIEIESPLTCVERKIGEHYYDIWCDDEGLLKEEKYIGGASGVGREILCGNLLIAKHDEEGGTIGLTKEEIDEVFSRISKTEVFLFYTGLDIRKDLIIGDYRSFGEVRLSNKGSFLLYEM